MKKKLKKTAAPKGILRPDLLQGDGKNNKIGSVDIKDGKSKFLDAGDN